MQQAVMVLLQLVHCNLVLVWTFWHSSTEGRHEASYKVGHIKPADDDACLLVSSGNPQMTALHCRCTCLPIPTTFVQQAYAKRFHHFITPATWNVDGHDTWNASKA